MTKVNVRTSFEIFPKHKIGDKVYVDPLMNGKLHSNYGGSNFATVTIGAYYYGHRFSDKPLELRYITSYSEAPFLESQLFATLAEAVAYHSKKAAEHQVRVEAEDEKKSTEFYEKAKEFVAKYEASKVTGKPLPKAVR